MFRCRRRYWNCGRIAGLRCWLVILLITTGAPVPSSACGFHTLDRIALKRGALNFAFPNALYVQGAIGNALRRGVLHPKHLSSARKPFAYHRIVRNLQRFADRVDASNRLEDRPFTAVLLGSVLWSTFKPQADRLAVESHTPGPLPGAATIVTDAPVIAALLAGDLSAKAVFGAGLMRFYGTQGDVEPLRSALELAFPGQPTSASGSALAKGYPKQ